MYNNIIQLSILKIDKICYKFDFFFLTFFSFSLQKKKQKTQKSYCKIYNYMLY